MDRYQNGLIYKIVCNNTDIKDTYVGSCCHFRKRKNAHKTDCNNKKSKKYNLRVYQFIRENGRWDNWSMIQIEPYPCNNKRELETRERYWLEQLNANLNSQIPSRTQKEYQQDNKDKIATQRKQYQQDNRDTISAKQKQYYQDKKETFLAYQKQYSQQKKEIRKCVCGITYNYGKSSTRNRHFSNQKHNNYITALHAKLQELMCQ